MLVQIRLSRTVRPCTQRRTVVLFKKKAARSVECELAARRRVRRRGDLLEAWRWHGYDIRDTGCDVTDPPD